LADIYDYPPGKDQYNKPRFFSPTARKWLIIFLLFVIYMFLRFFVSFKLDWTWFNVLGYDAVFWRTFTGKVLVSSGLFMAGFVITYLNIYFIFKLSGKSFRPWLSLVPAFFVAVLAAGNGSQLWLQILKYIHAQPFGITDPQFNLDIGFYVFKLPVFWLLYRMVNVLLLLNIMLTIPLYLFFLLGKIDFSSWLFTKRIYSREEKRGFAHLGFLLAFFLVWQAVQYKLSAFELLYSQEGSVIGAGATDLGVRLPAFNIMMILSLVIGVFVFFTIRKNMKRAFLAVAVYFILGAVLTGFFPSLYQKFVVDPDEMGKELPYLRHNINYTRQAYGLADLTEEEYPVGELTAKDINENRDIIDNIRLLDHRATKNIYAQQQENRFYYEFMDVDIDRYNINGKPTQVFLAARELNKKAVAESMGTFTNLMFKYTHGFGLVMSQANIVDKTGLPQYLIKDIPPRSSMGEVKEPRIYFGEATNDNIIVNTGLKEYDYPLGDDNQEYLYQGKKGIPLTFLNKVFLSLRDTQYKYLFSNYITAESKYLETRNVKARVKRIAPFLLYDQDPYLVLSQEGDLYYLLDAYTVTDKYPYSQAVDKKGTFNYIRNSVKVVVNAYSGEVDFYLFDKEDPLIKVYRNIYPALFKDKEEMPEDLRAHIRYPEDIFNIQSLMLRDYHMTNPSVFFTREDKWELGEEVYWDKLQTQEAFYSIIRLPGEEQEEFVMMRVFTPSKKKNMVSWLAARSDGENYGKLLLYKFPKGIQVPGTAQVESQIDQDPEISAQLSLWERGGSKVLRGNLLVYPLAGSLLYVEPLYIEAEQTKYPQLKKVFAYYKDTIVMEDTLEQALTSIFGSSAGKKGSSVEEGDAGKEDYTGIVDQTENAERLWPLVKRLSELQKQGKEKMQAGDWAGYGQVQQKIESVIKEMMEGLN
jgi:uncharacterized membrane protein (UPF0182 family)